MVKNVGSWSIGVCIVALLLYYFRSRLVLDLVVKTRIKNGLFTPEELSQFSHENHNAVYLAIMGKIYDVTTGGSYYGNGGAYSAFTGRDSSASFITGDFNQDQLTDEVHQFKDDSLYSLKNWADFYEKNYPYKGKLIGRYYDEEGNETPYNVMIQHRFKEHEIRKSEDEKLKMIYPPCNVEWSSEKGTRIWCTNRSGGIERDWVGYPRKMYKPGSKKSRCVCVDVENLTNALLEEYENCASDSESCYYISN